MNPTAFTCCPASSAASANVTTLPATGGPWVAPCTRTCEVDATGRSGSGDRAARMAGSLLQVFYAPPCKVNVRCRVGAMLHAVQLTAGGEAERVVHGHRVAVLVLGASLDHRLRDREPRRPVGVRRGDLLEVDRRGVRRFLYVVPDRVVAQGGEHAPPGAGCPALGVEGDGAALGAQLGQGAGGVPGDVPRVPRRWPGCPR